MVGWQEDYTWGVVAQPVAFLIFVTAMFAETGRTPFDVAEGESEIVGGFHTEYSSMKFALFFMGEYAHIVVASALISILFMGGYSIFPVNLEWLSGGRLPALDTEFIRANIGYVLMVGGYAAGLVLWFASLLIANKPSNMAPFKPPIAASACVNMVCTERLACLALWLAVLLVVL